MYAKVLIFLPIKAKSSPYFDYRVPPELASTVRPGVLVVVPLRTRKLPGIVMALADSSDLAPDDIRPIESVLDPEPVLDETRRKLAQWIARETLAPLHKCVQTMLPPGMRPKAYLRLTPLVTQLPPDLPDPAADLLRVSCCAAARCAARRSRAPSLRSTGMRRGARSNAAISSKSNGACDCPTSGPRPCARRGSSRRRPSGSRRCRDYAAPSSIARSWAS